MGGAITIPREPNHYGGRPLFGDVILTLQNDFEIKVRSTSAQPDEHVVFWISIPISVEP